MRTGRAAAWVGALAMLVSLPACRHEPPVLPLEDLGGIGGGGGGGPWVNTDPCDPDTVYFENTVLPLLVAYCAGPGCHDAITHEEDIRLYDYAHIMQQVTAGDPGESDLWSDGINETGEDAMPPAGEPQLSPEQEQLIYAWIQQGAQNNSCVGCDTGNVTYAGSIQPLFQTACNGCHSGSSPDGGLDLTSYSTCNMIALDGRLAGAVQHQATYQAMPPSGGMLPQCAIDGILIWIEDGAPNN